VRSGFSPSNTVKPNVGASELADALIRVLPFTASDDSRPILQYVRFEAKDGKLKLISADGFRLAVIALDFEGEEPKAEPKEAKRSRQKEPFKAK